MLHDNWPKFVCLNNSDEESLEAKLIPEGVTVWKLDGSTITSSASFLAQADKDFPHKTDLSCHQNWNAFDDWFWTELSLIHHEEGVQRVGIIWKDAHCLLDSAGLQDFLVVVHALCSVFDNLPKMIIKVYLLGTGSYFR